LLGFIFSFSIKKSKKELAALANHKSAVKRVKQAESKRMRNRSVKTRVKTEIRKIQNAIEENAVEAAAQALKGAQSLIDKAAKQGAMHKKTAARKISRLYKRVTTSKSA
jgi:small subunit ribosomal protein S20